MEGTDLDESEDENGTHKDETMYARKGKERVKIGDSIVDIEDLDVKSEDE
jgi:hypothetical protein